MVAVELGEDESTGFVTVVLVNEDGEEVEYVLELDAEFLALLKEGGE